LVCVLVAMFLAGALRIVIPVRAPAGATLALVNPLDGSSSFNFTPAQKSLGDTFDINITVTNAILLSCWQVGITWDPTLLQYVNVILPSDNVFAYDSPIQAHDDSAPGMFVGGACIGLGQTYFNGSGRLAVLTLKIIQAAGQVSCNIDFEPKPLTRDGDTFLLNGIVTILPAVVGASYNYTRVIRVPQDYKSIQAAIDATTPWTTILIGPGVYNESTVVNKPLTIIGRLGSEPIFNGGGSGIAITLLSNASGSTVAGIVITGWDQGILINGSSSCTIYNNIMSSLNSKGIVIQGASAVNNQVYSNIFQSDFIAVDVASSSISNNVSRNIICFSTTALKIESSQNIVCENMILNDQVGLSIVSSNSNIIYHNNFVNNTVQVSVSASTGNAWDNGYPSGGNYWSDHTSPDAYSGPSQNQPGADGIVDTPYIVAESGVDTYPLVQPFNAHDVGITDYLMSKTVVGKGYSLSLEVKVVNYGVYDEDFLVTAYADASTATAQAVKLTKSNYLILTLTWNTTGFAYGNYTVCACAGPVQNETNTADNNWTCSTPVHIGVPGDVSSTTPGVYDGVDNMKDIAYLVSLYQTKPNKPNWNPNADVNNDGVVDMKDIAIAVYYFNQHE